PGGRLAVFAWTPEGSAGEMFRVVGGHLEASGILLPDGPPPSMWGVEAHVAGLFAGTGLELAFERETLELRVGSVRRMMELYEDAFGPIVMARRALEPLGRWQGLRDDLEALVTRHATAGGAVFEAEYLAVDGRKSG
ncbi:MAG TPA: hypothetical protein VJT76_06690, partial [Gaiella sp.]|nr:hypothetical protein [Gaiella sp.]